MAGLRLVRCDTIQFRIGIDDAVVGFSGANRFSR